jgi:O-methyltransferase involved in polyketide biosynthesis
MSAEMPSKPFTYTSSPQGINILGRTRGQRTAEVMAGFRAEFDPSPETRALASFSGRVTARVLISLVKDTKRMIGWVVLRGPVMYELLRRQQFQNPTLYVDMAAGFSAVGLQMARDNPKAQVLEIDLPDVVKAKQERLSRTYAYELPPNLSWRTADFATTSLRQVIDGQQADAVLTAGLLVYFPLEEVQRITTGIYDALKPGGVFITDVMWTRYTTEAENARGGINAFRRQAADMHSMVHDESELPAMFPAFDEVEAHLVTKVAEEAGMDFPAIDYSFIVVARKKA